MKFSALKGLSFYLRRFLLIIFVFVLLLTLVYCIPDALIEKNVNATLEMYQEEGVYPNFDFHAYMSLGDNFTDTVMVERAIPENSSFTPLEAAMDMNGYSRYWHGYEVLLRPMLILLGAYNLKYVYMVIFFLLLTAVSLQIYEKFGKIPVFALMLSLLNCYLTAISMSMQHCNIWFITFIGTIFLLKRKNINSTLCFMILGMVTSFVDLLTIPVISLALPLIFLLALQMKEEPEVGLKEEFKVLLKSSAAWGMGFAGCWISKWLVASAVLRRNMITDALQTVAYRTVGNEESPGGALEAIQANLKCLFQSSNKAVFLALLGFLAVGMILLLFFHRNRKKVACAATLLAVAAYPYAWYAFASNHSIVHAGLLTYRLQIASCIAVTMFFYVAVDFKRCKESFDKIRNR